MVKNEGAIIERCLKSIIPIADLVIITDTGSTDDTVVKAGLLLQAHNIKFKIYTRNFVDFGHNRTLLLQLARQEEMDYVLMIDADEVLNYPENFDFKAFKSQLFKDYYDIKMIAGGLSYFLPRLTSNAKDFNYIGVTHEFLNASGNSGVVNELEIIQINDSARRTNNKKFIDDAKLLEEAISKETNEDLKTRYIFYLAQTYQNMGEDVKSFKYYMERLNRGGWREEIFYSYYQLGKLEEKYTGESSVNFYLKAYEALPSRVEPLVALRDLCRRRRDFGLASLADNVIKTIPKPPSGLFIEEDKYECTRPFSFTFS